jgi:hypothetical protein
VIDGVSTNSIWTFSSGVTRRARRRRFPLLQRTRSPYAGSRRPPAPARPCRVQLVHMSRMVSQRIQRVQVSPVSPSGCTVGAAETAAVA